jgi:hypothetical protein
MLDLHQELAHHLWLREGILAQCPDIDEQTLTDTLAGASNLEEAVIAVIRSATEDEHLIAALKTHIAELGNRLDRLEDRKAKKRELIAAVMERADLRRVVGPDATISLTRVAPKVLITDEALVPDRYRKPVEPVKPKPDKALIKEALTSGAAIPGATLSNGGVTITVRHT